MGTSFHKSDNTLSDNALVSAVKDGRYELFPVLFKHYGAYISSLSAKLSSKASETEDLIQEGTIALFSAVKAYEADKGNFSVFAKRCIKNALLDMCRKNSAKHNVPDSMLYSLDETEIRDVNTPEKIFFDNEALKDLTDTIKLELSTAEYNVLSGFLSGMTYSQIAESLNITVKSVDNALKRIRNKLKAKSFNIDMPV